MMWMDVPETPRACRLMIIQINVSVAERCNTLSQPTQQLSISSNIGLPLRYMVENQIDVGMMGIALSVFQRLSSGPQMQTQP